MVMSRDLRGPLRRRTRTERQLRLFPEASAGGGASPIGREGAECIGENFTFYA
jgi:hypothetical protein